MRSPFLSIPRQLSMIRLAQTWILLHSDNLVIGRLYVSASLPCKMPLVSGSLYACPFNACDHVASIK